MFSEKQLSGLIEELLEEELKTKRPVAKGGMGNDDNLPDDACAGGQIQGVHKGSCLQSKKKLSTGVAWVTNNEVMVEAQLGKHSLPIIHSGDGVDLFVNGEIIKGEVLVSNEDYIQVNLKTIETPLDFQIQKIENRLKAMMSVRLKTINRYHLMDHGPCKHLFLKSIVKTEKTFPLSFEEIIDALHEKGISYGVNYTAIQSFLDDPCDGNFIVAEGTPPKDPVDDSLAILFEERVVKQSVQKESIIDFYNFKQIPSVEKGALLAVQKDGKPGQPGMTVTGETLPPEEPERIIIKAGSGVKQKGNTIYATKSGRPMVTKIGNTWLFFIEPCLIRYGDIDISIGNQNFRGNITVYGNICDCMNVRAGGDIQVHGHINRAGVIALNSIRADKCFGSRVQAGGESYYIDNCCSTLMDLRKNLKGLKPVVTTILKQPQLQQYENKLGLLILLIMEKKYPTALKLLKSTAELLEITPIEVPDEISVLLDMIKENIPPRNLTLGKIETLIEYVEFARDFFKEMRNSSADVNIGYAVNSIISATGNVCISEQGCFSSTIVAGGHVIVNILRGGEIRAGGDIMVWEVGAEIGTKTILKTELDQKIRITNKAHDGTILNIGGLKYEVIGSLGPSEIWNKDDELKIRSLSGVVHHR